MFFFLSNDKCNGFQITWCLYIYINTLNNSKRSNRYGYVGNDEEK